VRIRGFRERRRCNAEEKTRSSKRRLRRRLTMPRSEATADHNAAFFRITHIAVHCTDGPLSLASSRASATRIRERHKGGKKGRTRERRMRAGPVGLAVRTKELRQAHSPKMSLRIRIFPERREGPRSGAERSLLQSGSRT